MSSPPAPALAPLAAVVQAVLQTSFPALYPHLLPPSATHSATPSLPPLALGLLTEEEAQDIAAKYRTHAAEARDVEALCLSLGRELKEQKERGRTLQQKCDELQLQTSSASLASSVGTPTSVSDAVRALKEKELRKIADRKQVRIDSLLEQVTSLREVHEREMTSADSELQALQDEAALLQEENARIKATATDEAQKWKDLYTNEASYNESNMEKVSEQSRLIKSLQEKLTQHEEQSRVAYESLVDSNKRAMENHAIDMQNRTDSHAAELQSVLGSMQTALLEKEAIIQAMEAKLDAVVECPPDSSPCQDCVKWRGLYEHEADQNEADVKELMEKKKKIAVLEKKVKELSHALDISVEENSQINLRTSEMKPLEEPQLAVKDIGSIATPNNNNGNDNVDAEVLKWRSLFENEEERNETDRKALMEKVKLIAELEDRIAKLSTALANAEEGIVTTEEELLKWKSLYENEVEQSESNHRAMMEKDKAVVMFEVRVAELSTTLHEAQDNISALTEHHMQEIHAAQASLEEQRRVLTSTADETIAEAESEALKWKNLYEKEMKFRETDRLSLVEKAEEVIAMEAQVVELNSALSNAEEKSSILTEQHSAAVQGLRGSLIAAEGEASKWKSLYDNEVEQNEAENRDLLERRKLATSLEKKVKDLTSSLIQAENDNASVVSRFNAEVTSLQCSLADACTAVTAASEESRKWKLLFENEVDQCETNEKAMMLSKQRLTEVEQIAEQTSIKLRSVEEEARVLAVKNESLSSALTEMTSQKKIIDNNIVKAEKEKARLLTQVELMVSGHKKEVDALNETIGLRCRERDDAVKIADEWKLRCDASSASRVGELDHVDDSEERLSEIKESEEEAMMAVISNLEFELEAAEKANNRMNEDISAIRVSHSEAIHALQCTIDGLRRKLEEIEDVRRGEKKRQDRLDSKRDSLSKSRSGAVISGMDEASLQDFAESLGAELVELTEEHNKELEALHATIRLLELKLEGSTDGPNLTNRLNDRPKQRIQELEREVDMLSTKYNRLNEKFTTQMKERAAESKQILKEKDVLVNKLLQKSDKAEADKAFLLKEQDEQLATHTATISALKKAHENALQKQKEIDKEDHEKHVLELLLFMRESVQKETSKLQQRISTLESMLDAAHKKHNEDIDLLKLQYKNESGNRSMKDKKNQPSTMSITSEFSTPERSSIEFDWGLSRGISREGSMNSISSRHGNVPRAAQSSSPLKATPRTLSSRHLSAFELSPPMQESKVDMDCMSTITGVDIGQNAHKIALKELESSHTAQISVFKAAEEQYISRIGELETEVGQLNKDCIVLAVNLLSIDIVAESFSAASGRIDSIKLAKQTPPSSLSAIESDYEHRIMTLKQSYEEELKEIHESCSHIVADLNAQIRALEESVMEGESRIVALKSSYENELKEAHHEHGLIFTEQSCRITELEGMLSSMKSSHKNELLETSQRLHKLQQESALQVEDLRSIIDSASEEYVNREVRYKNVLLALQPIVATDLTDTAVDVQVLLREVAALKIEKEVAVRPKPAEVPELKVTSGLLPETKERMKASELPVGITAIVIDEEGIATTGPELDKATELQVVGEEYADSGDCARKLLQPVGNSSVISDEDSTRSLRDPVMNDVVAVTSDHTQRNFDDEKEMSPVATTVILHTNGVEGVVTDAKPVPYSNQKGKKKSKKSKKKK